MTDHAPDAMSPPPYRQPMVAACVLTCTALILIEALIGHAMMMVSGFSTAFALVLACAEMMTLRLPIAGSWCTVMLGVGCLWASPAIDAVNGLFAAFALQPTGAPTPPVAIALAVPLAMYCLAYRTRAQAFMAGMLLAVAAAVHIVTQSRFGLAPTAVPLILLTAVTALAALLGFRHAAVRQRHERRRAQRLIAEQRDRMRRMQTITGRLHDSVTNDLAAIMLLSTRRPDGDAPANAHARDDIIHDLAHHALSEAHRAIQLLEGGGRDGTDHPGTHSMDTASPSEIPMQEVQDLLDANDRILHALGLRGASSVSPARTGANMAIPCDRWPLVRTAITEIRGNIARHADIDGGYDCTVVVDAQRCVILASNLIGRNADHRDRDAPVLGTGLRRLRERLGEVGGILSAHGTDEGEWLVRVVVPFEESRDGGV
ncbi:hypothetical protein [Bifidobacterium phasiani]|uniref:Signal transduction histidine kinase n=1 Tax=Bifidobacterium phasiani TaxID=2834431 RepID=A0ABS6W7U9_9BIFI|nr:hypothetical protein [Bifidobacterium phasiani]MBW3082265.1 hypothetical protein [Bifidobacterium phasiani]